MPVAFTFIALMVSIFGMYYLYITTRHRERIAMLEKNVDPILFSSSRQIKKMAGESGSAMKFTLKLGMFLIGIGVGFVLSVLFRGLVEENNFPFLVMGTIFIFGGAGLVAGFYMGRQLEKNDTKE